MKAAGFLAAVVLVRRLGPRRGLDTAQVSRLVLAGTIGGILGSKLLYLFVIGPRVLDNPWPFLGLRDGYVWYGTPLLGPVFVAGQARRLRIPVGDAFDVLTPGLALGLGIGRVGCFLAGCCHGKPTSSWVGIVQTGPQVSAHLRGIPLHATQLYEAAAQLVVLPLLLWLLARPRGRGAVFVAYMAFYALTRALIEMFRGDEIRGRVALVSTSQLISLAVLVGCAAAFVVIRRGQRTATHEAPLRNTE